MSYPFNSGSYQQQQQIGNLHSSTLAGNASVIGYSHHQQYQHQTKRSQHSKHQYKEQIPNNQLNMSKLTGVDLLREPNVNKVRME